MMTRCMSRASSSTASPTPERDRRDQEREGLIAAHAPVGAHLVVEGHDLAVHRRRRRARGRRRSAAARAIRRRGRCARRRRKSRADSTPRRHLQYAVADAGPGRADSRRARRRRPAWRSDRCRDGRAARHRGATRRGSRMRSARRERPRVVGEVQLRQARAVRHHHSVAGIDAVFLRHDDLSEAVVAPHPIAGVTQRPPEHGRTAAAPRARPRRESGRPRRRTRCPRRSSPRPVADARQARCHPSRMRSTVVPSDSR